MSKKKLPSGKSRPPSSEVREILENLACGERITVVDPHGELAKRFLEQAKLKEGNEPPSQ